MDGSILRKDIAKDISFTRANREIALVELEPRLATGEGSWK
jgi:hypothetical protein